MKVRYYKVPAKITVEIFPDSDLPNCYLATIKGGDGELDLITQGVSPSNALEMAYNCLRAAANLCVYPHELEHCFCREYSNYCGDGYGGTKEVDGHKCCRCDMWRRAGVEPEDVPVFPVINCGRRIERLSGHPEVKLCTLPIGHGGDCR